MAKQSAHLLGILANLLITDLPAALVTLSGHSYSANDLDRETRAVGDRIRQLAVRRILPADHRASDAEVLLVLKDVRSVCDMIRTFRDKVFSSGGTGLTTDLDNLYSRIDRGIRDVHLELDISEDEHGHG